MGAQVFTDLSEGGGRGVGLKPDLQGLEHAAWGLLADRDIAERRRWAGCRAEARKGLEDAAQGLLADIQERIPRQREERPTGSGAPDRAPELSRTWHRRHGAHGSCRVFDSRGRVSAGSPANRTGSDRESGKGMALALTPPGCAPCAEARHRPRAGDGCARTGRSGYEA